MPRIRFLAAMLGALFAANGRACVVAYPALPAPDAISAVATIPPLPDAGFDALPQPDEWNLAGSLVLSSNLDFGPANDESLPPDPPTPPGLLLPILAILTGGAAWRYYTSPAYRRLYRNLFGPLNQY